jgi:hypothetical protein
MAWARRVLVLLPLALLAGCGGDDGQNSDETLAGVWDLVGYSDHGVAAATIGTATFVAAGSFTIRGEVTFPGEPADSLNLAGTWSMTGNQVTLTTPGGTGDWAVQFSELEATLTRIGPAPASTIQLRRSGSNLGSACSDGLLHPALAAGGRKRFEM